MSASSGPNVEDGGLVFSIDMANTQKSWKGAPTTNLYTGTNASSGDQDGFGGGSFLDTNLVSSSPFNSETLYARKSNSGVATWSVTANLTAGVTYTYSIWCKTIAWTSLDIRRNEPGTYIAESKSVNVAPGVWTRVDFTFTVNTGKSGSQVVGVYVGNANISQPNQGIFLYAAQLEQTSVVTSYINGTRSSTQAILDIPIGSNTLAVSNLSYANNNTFSFDGNSSYVQSTSNCAITGSITLSAIIKPSYTGQTGPHSTIIGTDAGYPYGAKLMNYKNIARYGIWLGFGGVDSFEALIDGDINDNTIKMLTASWNQSTGIANIYLNGALQSSISTAKTIPTVLLDGKITIGTDYNSIGSANKNKFLGSIYYASIHNRALSTSEVAQNFQALRGRYGI